MLGPLGMAAQFEWSNTQVGYIYSAFGWAYTFMQIPGGWIACAHNHAPLQYSSLCP